MSIPSVAERRPRSTRTILVAALVVVAALVILVVLSLGSPTQTTATGSGSVLVLAPLAFIAGVLSFLSPCTLPILPAYFAFTFQAQKRSIVLMTVAFFLGLATTMVILGASATALSALVFSHLQQFTFWGGLIVIGFGIMSLLGKGFTGLQLQERPAVGIAGSYVYGATFALGWTACVGPILGSVLTALAAQGIAIIQGAVLAFIYALGLGLPLILVATFFSRLGNRSAFWRFMRGKGFDVRLGGATLYLHTTSIISGVLLIVMGYLLASGQLSAIAQVSQSTSLAQWISHLEGGISGLFGVR